MTSVVYSPIASFTSLRTHLRNNNPITESFIHHQGRDVKEGLLQIIGAKYSEPFMSNCMMVSLYKEGQYCDE